MKVLREILELDEGFACVELVDIGLKPEGAELRFKCSLEAHNAKKIDAFLKEKNLKMKREKEFVTISK